MISQKFIILDRDGVINADSDDYIKSADEWEAIPRSVDAIKKLSDNNFQVIIISNQSGIERGLISPLDFIQINIKMISAIDRAGGSISAILYCPSLPTSIDPNRKPSPGMFIDIASRMNIKLSNCYAIGDCTSTNFPKTAQVAYQQGKYLAGQFNSNFEKKNTRCNKILWKM